MQSHRLLGIGGLLICPTMPENRSLTTHTVYLRRYLVLGIVRRNLQLSNLPQSIDSIIYQTQGYITLLCQSVRKSESRESFSIMAKGREGFNQFLQTVSQNTSALWYTNGESIFTFVAQVGGRWSTSFNNPPGIVYVFTLMHCTYFYI